MKGIPMDRFQADILVAVLILHFGRNFAVADPILQTQAGELRDEVQGMFYHAFDNYMQHAFPMDELRPLSCSGEESLGEYTLTLVDALDMLALLGDREKFTQGVTWLGKNLHFDRNKTVSVFETTIRVLGGLLSGHLIASDEFTGMKVNGYQNELLTLAEALGRKLLPAFDTPTGIPYGSVNLLYGVSEDDSQVTSTAGGGTLTLEFGLLSRLTGDPVFETVAKNAVRGLWAQRSQLNLVGAHINVFTGEWTHKDAGIGTSIDSFYEYLLKAYLLFGDEEYLYMFKEAYKSVMIYLFNDPWYLEVNMNSAVVVWPLFNSLQAFWPGLQVLAGDVEPAVRTHRAFFAVWKKYGYTPEGFNLATSGVQPGQRSYPLRPELIESTYMLYKATRDPYYVEVGRAIVASIQYGARCPCGYCHIADVESHAQDDHMESFFLAETVKYLWLLFDLAAGGENLVETGPHPYIFSTEGHLFPLTPETALLPEDNISLRHFQRNGPGGHQPGKEDKGMTQGGTQFPSDLDSLMNRVNQGGLGVDIDCTDESDLAYRALEGLCQKLSLWRKVAVNYLADSAAGVAKEHKNLTAEGTDVKENDVIQSKATIDRKFIRDLLVSIVRTQESPHALPVDADDTLTIDKVEDISSILEITLHNQDGNEVQTSTVLESSIEHEVDHNIPTSLKVGESNAILVDFVKIQTIRQVIENTAALEDSTENQDAEGNQNFDKVEVRSTVAEDLVKESSD